MTEQVDGEVVAERTVIAQAIPPSGSLRLGCRPRDRPPGAALAEVELYLFRMWADLDDHAACEEGSVIGWDSQFWGVTSARARQRDPNLPCALSRTTTTSSPVIATSLKHTLSQSQVTVSPMSEASGTRSTEQPTDDPAGISSQTEHPSVTPSLNSSVTTTTSTNATPPTTLSPVSRSTNSPAADGTPSYTAAMLSTTVPATTVTANRDPDHSPVSPVTSDHGATSDATSHPASSAPPSDASPTNQIPTSTQTSPITTLRANQTTPPKSLTTGSPLVNCDITRLCSNEHAYYWMFLSVKATGTNRTETDVHDWVSNVFSCDTEAVRATTAAHDADMMDLCQGGRKLQIVEVSCDANEDIRRANCSLLLQLSHAVSVCKLQHALQRAGDEPLQARLIGEVERVGRELCEDVEPSSGGFVRCTSSSSLGDICQSDTHSGLTCSFIELGSTPLPQPERESCSWEEPRFCDCTAFCRDTRQFFALSINISSPTVDVNFIESMLSKLGIAPACDTMSESLCTNYVEVSRRYQGAHLECHGTKQRLYSCMVILETSGPVDVCSLANFLQRHMDNSSGITNDEPLTRMAVCGPPGLPANDLLASNLTWVASNLLHSEICQPDHTLKCDGNETFAVLLTDSCQDPPEPLPTNPSTLQPSPLSNNNTTTPSETTPPSPANTTQQNNTTAENNAATQPKNASEGTVAQPNATAQLSSTQTSTAPSVLQASTQNTTTTATPLLTTLYFNTTATTQNTTHYNVTFNATLPTISPRTDNTVNTTLFPTFWLNTTLPNITAEAYTTAVPLNTTNSARTNTTQHNTTAIQPSTTQLGIWESNSTHPNTTACYTTVYNETATNNGKLQNRTVTAMAQETTKNSQEEEEEAAAELLDQTQDASQLNASQVEQVVGSLEKLLEGPTVSQSVGQTAINVISNLMEGDALALAASANRLIRAVDDLGFKLVIADESEVLSSNSLLVAVRTVDGTNFPAASINIFNTADLQLNVLGRSRSRSRSSQTALGSVYLPSSLTEGLSPEEQRQASRVQFTFYTTTSLFQDAALDNQTIVSPVLGSSVANLSISNLRENIQFTIQNINPLPANYVASCAFWDFSLNGGGGGWNSAGCFLLNTTQENTSCSCNHLTSFAILLDVSRGEGTNPQHALILTFITYIGCGISAIFLAVTLFTYICFQKLLRDIPSKILVQLCMSLFLLNLLFLLDGWLALYPSTGLCISTAFFLHYFLLTSFTWAGLEALHMYLSIIRVFTPYLSRYMLKFSLLGWGVPLIVVIVVISVDKNNYGLVTYGKNTNGSSDDFCWLRNDIAFYVGVVAYFILIFALTLLVFIVVLVQLARIKRQNPQNQSPQRGLMTDLRSIAGLVILLGLTWGFALFAWGPLYLPFIYLFSIFNSLQGFFIFVFHCAVKENVRRQWRTYLCCGRLRLAENSEWSRTATQNPKKLSVTTATSSALNPASRSSSVISEGTNSSGSVFGDSGISDGGSNSDVVLNEIHRRNAALQDMA
uniref:uncharacterized protein adgrg2a n=1 Tax=Centroberyx gerrardi TaxID=166262 RepID=UPI003AAC943A